MWQLYAYVAYESIIRVYLSRNLWTFSMFRTFCFPSFYGVDLFVLFVLRQLWVLQVFTLRMSHILFVVQEVSLWVLRKLAAGP